VSLTRRLLLSYLAIVTVTGIVLTVAADRALRSRLEEETERVLEREARYFASAASRLTETELDSLVHVLGAATGRRLTIIARDGRVIADSDFPRDQLSSLENHATRPEFAEALRGRVGVDSRLSTSTGRRELKVAVGWPDGAVRVSATLTSVDAVVDRAQGAVLLGAIVAVIGAGFLAWGFAHNVARPLVRLRDAAQAITRGERPRLDVRGRHEVGELARALQTMDEALSGRLADLERERSETAALIGSMVEGVVACDARGGITTMNPAARDLLGLTPGEAPPPAGELFLPRVARDVVEDALAGRMTAGAEVEIGARTVLLTGHPLAQGGAVVVLHDVTDLKRLETVRRDFVANVSHELKTPLTVVRGYAETLRKDDPPPEIRGQFLETILHNARRMQQLVDDLLDLSRIESGVWRPEPGDVAVEPIVRDVWAQVATGARGEGRAFALELAQGADRLRADPEALRQVLTNILDNAVRHTPAGGRVVVRTHHEATGTRLDVTDTGPGIPSEHLPRIFERFYRVDPARSRELGGTGLGLSIVKHLVEAHGGHVEARSALGAGTTITAFFPAA
jgi:two-component system phosphate regulon sensor histidine kinase PhoR